MTNSLDFSHEEVERAARYHRPRYAAVLARAVLSAAVLLALAALGRDLDGAGWVGAALVWSAVVVLALDLVSLPLDWWSGYVREHRFGFSTQTPGGWLADRGKGAALGVALAAAVWLGLVALARALPSWWVAPAAAAAALLVLFLGFVAPVVLEPIFNRFRRLDDEQLVASLHAVAERAGTPVREILVADASRRTTKWNAYVSGLGASRRVVLWDTLVRGADANGIALVLAHELGHRRMRHVAKLSVLGMALAAVVVVLLRGAFGQLHARDLPLAVLLVGGAQAAIQPFLNALSRRYERQADRFALRVVGEPATFVATMSELARRNLADLEPPRLAYLFLFSHPTPPERLALAGRLPRA